VESASAAHVVASSTNSRICAGRRGGRDRGAGREPPREFHGIAGRFAVGPQHSRTDAKSTRNRFPNWGFTDGQPRRKKVVQAARETVLHGPGPDIGIRSRDGSSPSHAGRFMGVRRPASGGCRLKLAETCVGCDHGITELQMVDGEARNFLGGGNPGLSSVTRSPRLVVHVRARRVTCRNPDSRCDRTPR
jgi:hypothetical protein